MVSRTDSETHTVTHEGGDGARSVAHPGRKVGRAPGSVEHMAKAYTGMSVGVRCIRVIAVGCGAEEAYAPDCGGDVPWRCAAALAARPAVLAPIRVGSSL